MRILKLGLLALCFSLPAALCAQSPIKRTLRANNSADGITAKTPIEWTMAVEMTDATHGRISLTANVSEGWHFYGTELPDDGPRPTVFNFDNSKDIIFTDEFIPSVAPADVFDPSFAMDLSWWDGNVTFTRNFIIDTDADAADAPVINGSVTYMCCDNINCMPPRTVNFSQQIKVADVQAQ